MKLSREAERVLQLSMRQNRISDEEREQIAELIERMPDDRVLLYKNVVSNPIGDLPRYSAHIRIQHLLTFTTFLLLAFTGLPVHFPDAFWAAPFNSLLGGIEVTRVIHRSLAAIMLFSMVYHVLTIIAGTALRIAAGRFDFRRTVIPLFKDLKDMTDDALYFAGRRDQRPMMDKFMYKQKIHYFAAAFGKAETKWVPRQRVRTVPEAFRESTGELRAATLVVSPDISGSAGPSGERAAEAGRSASSELLSR